MSYSVNVDKETNRCLSVMPSEYASPELPQVDNFPTPICDYLYIDGEFIYDPLPEPVEPEPEPSAASITPDEMAAAIMEGVKAV